MVQGLMATIRGQFYGSAHPRDWLRDETFLKREVVLWPASWLRSRGMTMSPTSYESMILEKIQDVKRNANQGAFKYFPAYLSHCIKDHFRHNEERIYTECKSVSAPLSAVLGKLRPNQGPDLVETLVAARDVLVNRKRAKSTLAPARPTAARPGAQAELF
jgi:hypothetical protein